MNATLGPRAMRARPRWLLLCALCLGTAMGTQASADNGTETGADAKAKRAAAGRTAPDFTLTDLAGRAHSLRELRRDRHVLLIFWATDCVYCHALLPELKQAQRRYAGRGLRLAAINIGGEHREEVAAYVRDYGVNYLTLTERAHNLDVAEAYGVVGTPTLVLISPDGQVLYYGHKLPDLKRWLPPAG